MKELVSFTLTGERGGKGRRGGEREGKKEGGREEGRKERREGRNKLKKHAGTI